jgi:hypothetical protein
MSDQVQILIAFILYIVLFAWIGSRRGTRREMAVLLVSVGSYFGLQHFRSLIVRTTNLGSRFVAFVQAGGLQEGTSDSLAVLREGPTLVQPGQEQTYLFLLWALILLLTYILSEKLITYSGAQSKLIAAMLGIANGFFYITVVLPRLMALLSPSAPAPGELVAQANARQVLGGSLGVLADSFRSLWETVEPQQSLIFLIILSALLIAAASTLRNTRRA